MAKAMNSQVYLAIDLGAESGRVMAGRWTGKRMLLEEVHRFANGPVWLGESLRWDLLRLWQEIQHGLGLAARQHGRRVVSVGADTWGVDYVLMSRKGELLGLPYAYRDARTQGEMERVFRKVPRARLFEQTGLQFLPFNTLFQLLAHQRQHPEVMATAHRLLFIPDFVHWALCGSEVAEFTIASTSQCLDAQQRTWAVGLLKKLGLPVKLLPEIVPPGTRLGRVRASVAARIGLDGWEVVAPPAHDTASAVAAVPTTDTGKLTWAYISSGTWSLMGVEVTRPVLTSRALEVNITNEGGVDGTYRLLKNIMGLWLVQQCRKAFEARGRSFTYPELVQRAGEAAPLRSLVNPDDPRFLNPPDMPRAIQEFCQETGQPVPRTEGELVRCAFESLALRYRQVLGWLEELLGRRLEVIHIVGGGSQNRLLNQFTADACQRPVVTGPAEATAMGNVLTQMRARGELKSLAEMREVVRKSTDLGEYEPRQAAAWEEAYARFQKLTELRRGL
jgi:rhamnulokinase